MYKILVLAMMALVISCTTEYHVSVNGTDENPGSSGKPFRTISRASEVAAPGDVIIVHEGVYREKVSPWRGGESDQERITYKAAEGENAEIKGSEVISGWEHVDDGVWKVSLPNEFFGDHNPYKIHIAGDWLVDGHWNHAGEVYLNGKSLYETDTLEEVMYPEAHERALDSVAALYTWYCESNDDTTTLWANFHGYDPNSELVEITVRESCFYPDATGINYITIDGFHMSQAATQWAPPSAEQVGLIGTNWSKGWIIQNCTLHDSKCSGITLGKDRKSGHNGWLEGTSGAEHYTKIVRKALESSGWSRENIGSHIVRNNTIYNCEQAGICGSLGAVFSEVSHNHIYDIWTKRLFFGYEIGAIKFHAPIDVLIENNHLHDAHKGMWLDWMTQGTRISGNVCYNNEFADFFSEVNHGPYLVDNNIFLSGIHNWSEGGAYVHNLIAGQLALGKVMDRSTPFQEPHSTAIKGMSTTGLGDDRFYNNIFVAGTSDLEIPGLPGLQSYNKVDLEYSVYMDHNIYYAGAVPYSSEKNYVMLKEHDPCIRIENKDLGLYLHIILDEALQEMNNPFVDTELLGTAVRTGQAYEQFDGSPLKIDMDIFGNKRDPVNPTAGPFEDPGTGELVLTNLF